MNITPNQLIEFVSGLDQEPILGIAMNRLGVHVTGNGDLETIFHPDGWENGARDDPTSLYGWAPGYYEGDDGPVEEMSLADLRELVLDDLRAHAGELVNDWLFRQELADDN